MENERNYVAEYYKNRKEIAENVKNFFNKENNKTEEIEQTENTIRKLVSKVKSEQKKLNNLYKTKYGENFTNVYGTILLKYTTGSLYNTSEDIYFLHPSGIKVDIADYEGKNYELREVTKKTGDIKIVIGYKFEYGSVIIEYYHYTINKDNTLCKFTYKNETIVPILEKYNSYWALSDQVNIESRTTMLDKIDAKGFMNGFYKVDKSFGMTLADISDCIANNTNFETIVKTAPSEIQSQLLKLVYREKPCAIYKMINMDKEAYEKAVENGSVLEFYELRDAIRNKDMYHLTQMEWVELIEDAKRYTEDLEFNNVNIDKLAFESGYYYYNQERLRRATKPASILLYGMAEFYKTDYIRKNYTFKKLIKYVVDESINQGYTEVREFLNTLKDYINMCNLEGVTPTLYSSYLQLTHDITSRNHKIKVEKEQEEMFGRVYSEYKPYTESKYTVIAPKTTSDLKKEGDRLNHCVFSYLKRILNGDCKILFLREKDNVNESLITMEIRNSAIVQVKGMHNRKPTDEEVTAIKKFAKARELAYNA